MAANKQAKGGIGCLGVVGLCFILYLIGSNGGASKSDALFECQNAVKAKLKSPSSVQFAHYGDSTITEVRDNTFRITSHVDSQNSFGAMMRSDFSCECQYKSKDNWIVSDVKIYNR